MQITTTHKIGDREVTIKELSVAEIRKMLAAEHVEETAEQPIDVVGEILCEMSLTDILSMTDMTREELEALAPSQINELAEKCMEVNAAFFAMARKVNHTTALLNAAPQTH